MQKTLYLLLPILILALIGTGGTYAKNTDIHTVRVYTYQESTEPLKPTVALEEDGQFQFTYSALSSHLPHGAYQVHDGYLSAQTDDGSYTYVFQITDNALIFDAKRSSSFPPFADVPDGAVFKQSGN